MVLCDVGGGGAAITPVELRGGQRLPPVHTPPLPVTHTTLMHAWCSLPWGGGWRVYQLSGQRGWVVERDTCGVLDVEGGVVPDHAICE